MRYRALLVLLVWLLSSAIALVASDRFLDLETYAERWRESRGHTGDLDPRVLLVGLEDDLFENGLFRREVHAHVLGVLREAGARLVFYDVLFDEDRDSSEDALLAEALSAWPAVVLGGSFTIHENTEITPPHLAPALSEAEERGSAVIGTIEKPEENDGLLQNYFLGIRSSHGAFPSCALACFALLENLRPGSIRYQEESIELSSLSIPIDSYKPEGSELTTYIFPITFHQPATGPGNSPGPKTFPLISYTELLEPTEEIKQQLKGAVVIIGENTSGPTDLVPTPVGEMKGFEVHAQCLNRLLAKDFYTTASDKVRFQIVCLVAALVAGLGLLTWPLPVLLLTGVGIPLLYTAVNFWFFEERNYVLPLSAPVVAALIALACLVLVRVILASRFLSRFIPVEASRGLMMSKQVAQATNSTVIVSDIRGYTTLSESKTPTEILQMLNEYHSVTVEIFQKHGGNVLTFQGDAQLIVFGFPRKLNDPVGQAVKSTLEVMEAIAELRTKWGIDDPSKFDVGAGICSGVVYIGDIGSNEQANYTVIGEVVRTSHKVQSMSDKLEGNVLMDEASWERCKDKPQATEIPNVQLEGFPDKKTIYRVDRLGPEA